MDYFHEIFEHVSEMYTFVNCHAKHAGAVELKKVEANSKALQDFTRARRLLNVVGCT